MSNETIAGMYSIINEMALNLRYPPVVTYISTEEAKMPEKKPKWVSLGEAAKHAPVTRQTLRRMIKEERIPDDCWKIMPVQERNYYLIDLNCLDDIEFGRVGRPPKS